ncbi:MAG: helix-turn-helix domain-containing protein [Pseudomonadota bacterium]|nr:helix-turn-helix domain-containing protein [Pseudomonadota bacterium]
MKIAFVAYDSCLSSSISLPLEMLNAAAETHRAINNQAVLKPQVFGNLRKVQAAGGLNIHTDSHPRNISDVDLIILPAIWRNPLTVIRRQHYLLELLKQWHAKGINLCAVGTSSSFFAEAGLLHQRPATTHWGYFDQFQKRYPEVHLEKNFLITRAKNIYCAGSVNSVADLIIYFIETFYGSDIARRVEANFSPEVRQSYAKSMYNEGEHTRHSDEDIARLLNWLNENYGKKVTAQKMAELLGISIRTLNRRFKTATRQSPQDYLRAVRIGHAKELLQKSNLSVAEVAEQCGFNDNSHFGSTFKKVVSMPPSEYREAVKTKLFSSGTTA